MSSYTSPLLPASHLAERILQILSAPYGPLSDPEPIERDGFTYAEVTQTLFVQEGDSEFGGQRGRVYGNCWQAAIASYFSMKIDAVPAFAQFTWPDPAIELWARGIGMTHKQKSTTEIPDRLCIVGGHSVRGGLHAVLGYAGGVIWDPHPSRAGLIDVTEVEWFEPWPDKDRTCWLCESGRKIVGPLSDEPRELEWEPDPEFDNCWHSLNTDLPEQTRWRYPLWSVRLTATRWDGDTPVENIRYSVQAHQTTLASRDTPEEAKSLAASLQSILDGRPLWTREETE